MSYHGYRQNTVTFNHYTDYKGKQAIKKEGVIRESTDTMFDAQYGQGVYGTSKSPREGKRAILENNYDGMVEFNRSVQKKADFAISVEVPCHEVERVDDPYYRDILVHRGDLDLTDKNVRIHRVPKNPK